ncbi:MAG: hypothetical protein JWN67_4309 [Actinomycetia bacterium]|nr:hypothetical protein [Actinomycetes bacterium]
MSDKRARDLALEALVYVPVGLAVSAKELLPELARRGREKVTGQVTQARFVGRFAVQQGQVQAGKAFTRAREEAQGRVADLGSTPAPPVAEPVAPQPRAATSGPAGAGLAIPGYDSLSASQVLPRLVGLAPDELEAVRAYEAEHRGRKTILGRIAQLQ